MITNRLNELHNANIASDDISYNPVHFYATFPVKPIMESEEGSTLATTASAADDEMACLDNALFAAWYLIKTFVASGEMHLEKSNAFLEKLDSKTRAFTLLRVHACICHIIDIPHSTPLDNHGFLDYISAGYIHQPATYQFLRLLILQNFHTLTSVEQDMACRNAEGYFHRKFCGDDLQASCAAAIERIDQLEALLIERMLGDADHMLTINRIYNQFAAENKISTRQLLGQVEQLSPSSAALLQEMVL